MKRAFPGFAQPTREQFEELWQACIFVLDTNVLLNLYRYPPGTCHQLLSVIEKVRERLWVPYQVGLEFQRNRFVVLAERKSLFRRGQDGLVQAKAAVERVVESFTFQGECAHIQPNSYTTAIFRALDEFASHLERQAKGHPDVYEPDPLLERISTVLDGKVGARPESQKVVDGICAEGDFRYTHRIPPGYMDAEKKSKGESEEYYYGGILYQARYGDWLLWTQLLSEAARQQWKAVVFVTDDQKEDWWHVAHSAGKMTLGPRPELVAEMSDKAKVRLFHMYSSPNFMRLAKEHLKIEVSEDAIKDVEDIAGTGVDDPAGASPIGIRKIEEAVKGWLSGIIPYVGIEFGRREFPDFIIDLSSGLRKGVDVTCVRDRGSIGRLFRKRVLQAQSAMDEQLVDDVVLVVVVQDESLHAVARIAVEQCPAESLAGVTVVVGRVGSSVGEPDKLEFTPVLQRFSRPRNGSSAA
jgi:hypothetical protein